MFESELTINDVVYKVKDLEIQRKSIKKEIDENQILAMALSQEVEKKCELVDKLREEVKQLQADIVTKRDDLQRVTNQNSIDEAKLVSDRENLRVKIEAYEKGRHELEVARKAQAEEVASIRESLAKERMKIDADALEAKQLKTGSESVMKDAYDKQRKLEEALERVKDSEKKAEQELMEAKQTNRQAKKAADDLEAEKMSLKNDREELSKMEASLQAREEALMRSTQVNDDYKKQLEDREKDLLINSSRLYDAKAKLEREIQLSKLDEDKKKVMKESIK